MSCSSSTSEICQQRCPAPIGNQENALSPPDPTQHPIPVQTTILPGLFLAFAFISYFIPSRMCTHRKGGSLSLRSQSFRHWGPSRQPEDDDDRGGGRWSRRLLPVASSRQVLPPGVSVGMLCEGARSPPRLVITETLI